MFIRIHPFPEYLSNNVGKAWTIITSAGGAVRLPREPEDLKYSTSGLDRRHGSDCYGCFSKNPQEAARKGRLIPSLETPKGDNFNFVIENEKVSSSAPLTHNHASRGMATFSYGMPSAASTSARATPPRPSGWCWDTFSRNCATKR